MCADGGEVRAASVVDHIRPHRGDQTLFWDQDNWQPLCKDCHEKHKQAVEKRGFDTNIGCDGWPTDDKHPVNARTGGVYAIADDA